MCNEFQNRLVEMDDEWLLKLAGLLVERYLGQLTRSLSIYYYLIYRGGQLIYLFAALGMPFLLRQRQVRVSAVVKWLQSSPLKMVYACKQYEDAVLCAAQIRCRYGKLHTSIDLQAIYGWHQRKCTTLDQSAIVGREDGLHGNAMIKQVQKLF